MNRRQREQNKHNAKWLSDNAVICPECGQRGKHYIAPQGWLGDGFWTCPNLYEPVTKRRREG